jgi:hypothetical protein
MCSVYRGASHYRKKGMFVGENAGNWKGGKIISPQGYVYIYSPYHPSACYGYVKEHRLVIEKYVGRFLKRKECVHHIDKNKTNNHINNLMLFANSGSHLKFEWGKKVNPDEILFDGRKVKKMLP